MPTDTTISHSSEETRALGRVCGKTAWKGQVFALDGDLGAGKTQFAKGLVEGVGYKGAVTSPSFPLVHEYLADRTPVFHFDFYRLKSVEEVLDLGFDDYLVSGGILVIEWASKFPEVLPPDTRWFRFEIGEGDERRIVETSV
jgi:tRNA threonylcarbamoyladenosine biosynthesis protein TsaE